MADRDDRLRVLYRSLLRRYPRTFRARFGASMEQTFEDLRRERRDAGRGSFGFIVWAFAETSVGIVRENMTSNARVAWGTAVPLGLVALAYVLWWLSDRLLYVGPFDRAAFGWAVVIPVWLAAPVAAGFAWRGLRSSTRNIMALVVGALVAGVAAVLFWQSVAYPNCEYGATHTPAEWILPSLVLGAVIGGGLAISALVTSATVRQGRPWLAVVVGAGTEVVMVFAAILVAGMMLLGPGCQRPPV
jgi:hypothetical protein